MDSRLGLPKNTVLDGSYRIDRVIGSGGFGVTYLAEDTRLKTKVALKEYYPVEFGARDRTMSVRPKSERHKPTFDWGRTSFLQEAQMLARFRHPSIVRVTRVFEAHSTAYMVMDFEQGQSFEAWLKGLGRPPTQAELDRILVPLLDALETLHAAKLLHRDIAPDNILIRGDSTPVLLDFGSARRAVAEKSRALTGVVKAGYSPHEQYAADGRLQGPWTDFYALGATLYRAVAGHQPEEATLRFTDDRMRTAAEIGRDTYRPGFLAAIDACLKVAQSERPQSMAELRPMLLGQGEEPPVGRATGVSKVAAQDAYSPPPAAPSAGGAGRWLIPAAAAIVLLGGIYGGVEYARRSSAQQEAQTRRAEDERRRDAAAEESRRQEEARREAETKEAERRKAEDDRRAEEEAKRRADADAARRRADDEARTRPPAPNDPIRVAAPASWNGECVSDPLPQVTVVAAPTHGTIEMREGKTRIRNVAKGSGKCIGTEQNARVVNYVPRGQPVATDQLSLSVSNARGSRYIIDCTVNAIERKTECRNRR